MSKRSRLHTPSNELRAPLSVIRGEQVEATYMEQSAPEFKGNPLLEALPAILSHSDVEKKLSYFPEYDPSQRELSEEIRLHLLENSRELFIPQAIHYEIHLSISNMLRRGYMDRNPVTQGASAAHRAKVTAFADRIQRRAFLRSRARGLCIFGVGGLGKSTAVERLLSLYPQVITHRTYEGQPFILRQLVWLKLQCPGDGSLRALCINFLGEVDDILGTNYVDNYRAHRMTRDELLLAMARVASNHYLGMVFFDEIQDLSEAKSGGAAHMLNFFVQMENVLGIPFGLIGTPKARALFAGEFRQARRVSEQGDFFWHPMAETVTEANDDSPVADPEWETFVRAIWEYWYLRKDHPLPQNILKDTAIRALYELSKGIPAVVVTIFFLAQRRAITSGKEDITKAIINSTVKDCQYFVSRILESLSGGQSCVGGKHEPMFDIDSTEWRISLTTNRPESGTESLTGTVHRSPKSAKAQSRDSTRRSKRAGQYEKKDFRKLSRRTRGSKSASSDRTGAFAKPDEFH
jgi:AAA domain